MNKFWLKSKFKLQKFSMKKVNNKCQENEALNSREK